MSRSVKDYLKEKGVFIDISEYIWCGNYDCSYNNLTSLEGISKYITGDLTIFVDKIEN